MSKRIICALMMTAGVAQADTFLGVYVGVNHWQQDMSGHIRSDWSGDAVGVDFSDSANNFYLAFEHAVPFVPNVMVMRSEVQASGLLTLSDVAQFPGQSVDVDSEIDFSHNELTLYYEVLDNWVNWDLGLSFKHFDGGSYFYADSVLDERSGFDDVIPMLYTKAQFDLPLTGWSVYGSADALSFDDNDVTDFEIGVNYESKIGLGATVGFRSMKVDLVEVGDLTSDLTVDGFFAGVNFHF